MKLREFTTTLLIACLVSLMAPLYAGPLHEAAKKGNASEVERLLDGGQAINDVDEMGATALHWAVKSGNAKAVDALLNRGADIQVPSAFGSTVLHWAAAEGNAAIIRRLLAAGADVNQQNYAGITPTQVAREERKNGALTALQREGGREPGKKCIKSRLTSAQGYTGYRVECSE